jgi:hypothetical protein
VRKALILTRNFPPLVTDGASRAWKIASNLVSIGWEPIVVAPPAIAAMPPGIPSGSNPVQQVYRTAPDIDASKLEPADRNALLHGRPVAALRPFSARVAGIFRDNSEGAAWEKSAAEQVERLLAAEPEIDLLYAQGPPIEPLRLALETAKNHRLAVVLDIMSPLDPSMPAPGSAASSAEAKEEERILLSGVPMITPTRALKEYFLKKYLGRLDHGSLTILPNAFDRSHPLFKPKGAKSRELTLRFAMLVDALPKSDVKALVAGLEAWIKADGIRSGEVELTLFGEGVHEVAGRAARSPIKTLLVVDDSGSIGAQLEHCRKADVFCAVSGRSPASTCTVPDRLVDALGMGIPLCAVLPDGFASRLVTDAGGMTAAAGDAAAIGELFRNMAAMWRGGTLQGAPRDQADRLEIGAVIHQLTGAIANQFVS